MAKMSEQSGVCTNAGGVLTCRAVLDFWMTQTLFQQFSGRMQLGDEHLPPSRRSVPIKDHDGKRHKAGRSRCCLDYFMGPVTRYLPC